MMSSALRISRWRRWSSLIVALTLSTASFAQPPGLSRWSGSTALAQVQVDRQPPQVPQHAVQPPVRTACGSSESSRNSARFAFSFVTAARSGGTANRRTSASVREDSRVTRSIARWRLGRPSETGRRESCPPRASPRDRARGPSPRRATSTTSAPCPTCSSRRDLPVEADRPASRSRST